MTLKGGSRNTSGKQVFVSVITVVYNSEQFLERTINSIKNQVSKDYEYLVIDGASKDNTLEIIQKNDAYIDFWISEQDKGIYDAMNKGIQKARGKYLWFINSGDEIANADTLQKVIDLNKAADVFYGESYLVDTSGRQIGLRSELSTRKLPRTLTWKSLQFGMTVSHQSILVRKEIAPMYNLNYKCSADIDWVVESLKKSKHIINCHLVMSKYLVGGYSVKNVRRCWKERFAVFRKHYGLAVTLLNHVLIGTRFIYYKISAKANY